MFHNLKPLFFLHEAHGLLGFIRENCEFMNIDERIHVNYSYVVSLSLHGFSSFKLKIFPFMFYVAHGQDVAMGNLGVSCVCWVYR